MKKKCVLIIFTVLFVVILTSSEFIVPITENLHDNTLKSAFVSLLKENPNISERAANAIFEVLSDEKIVNIDYLKEKTDSNGNLFFRIFSGTYYYDVYLLGDNIVKCLDEDGNMIYFDENKNNELIRITELKNLLVLKNITRTVTRGDSAGISFRKLKAGEVCYISVVYFSGNKSTAKGLEPKTVSENGEVAWTWKVSGNVTPGIATVTVSSSSFTYSYEIMIEDNK